MRNLVESILNKEYTKANDHLHEELKNIVARKLHEAKKMLAAKMSVGEQLNVDKNGNYDETGGRDVILSHEKQKRGLTEGNVANIGTTHKTENYTVSVGRADDAPVVVTHNKSGTKTRITHSDAKAFIGRIAEKGKLTDSDVDNLKAKYQPESMKEEAKRAAMKSLQEKVRAKNVTPETIKAAQEHSDRNKNNSTSPATIFRQKKSETNPNYNVVKMVKEQGHSAEDSATVGKMAQQASDSGKVGNIIQRDADSNKVGQLSKQQVTPNTSREMPMSKMHERPGVTRR